jgi:sugar phosphate isomerase/epimerase
LCEAALPYDVTLCLEFAKYTAIPNIAAAQRLIRASGATNARILLDTLHLARSGGSAADVLATDPSLLSYIQICDARVEGPSLDKLRWEAQNDRLLPGEGVLPLTDIVRAMPPDTVVSVETPVLALQDLPPAERVRVSVEATRALLTTIGG